MKLVLTLSPIWQTIIFLLISAVIPSAYCIFKKAIKAPIVKKTALLLFAAALIIHACILYHLYELPLFTVIKGEAYISEKKEAFLIEMHRGFYEDEFPLLTYRIIVDSADEDGNIYYTVKYLYWGHTRHAIYSDGTREITERLPGT